MKSVGKVDEQKDKRWKHVRLIAEQWHHGNQLLFVFEIEIEKCSLRRPFTLSWTQSSNCFSAIVRISMQPGVSHFEKTMHIIAVYFHTLFCWKPCSLWDMQRQQAGSELGRAEAWKEYTSTNACWILICIALAIFKFESTATSSPWQSRHFVGAAGVPPFRQWGSSPPARPSLHPAKARVGSREGRSRGERERRQRAEGCESQTCNFSQQLDGAHLHTLMHHSSASLYHSVKHYIYFPNANLC